MGQSFGRGITDCRGNVVLALEESRPLRPQERQHSRRPHHQQSDLQIGRFRTGHGAKTPIRPARNRRPKGDAAVHGAGGRRREVRRRQGRGDGEGGRLLLRYTHVGAARGGESLPGSEQGGDREQRLFARCKTGGAGKVQRDVEDVDGAVLVFQCMGKAEL